MSHSFILIDDDLSIRKMLVLLIAENNMGRVLLELKDGRDAVDEILFFRPDIVIIDMLLPGADGISIINETIQKGFQGKFIMVSQVEDPSIISKAYESGILFFLNKPINRIEATSILKTVMKANNMEKSIDAIKNTISFCDTPMTTPRNQPEKDVNLKIQSIFSDIGIVNEAGAKDIKEVILKVLKLRNRVDQTNFTLQEMYYDVLSAKLDPCENVINIRSFEQRIRRLVLKALNTVAEMGAEDYYNLKFMDYSTILFDLKEVKKEIQYINHEGYDRGKINIKKFIEGFCSKLDTL